MEFDMYIYICVCEGPFYLFFLEVINQHVNKALQKYYGNLRIFQKKH